MKSILVCGLLICFLSLIIFGAGQERGREEKGTASAEQLIQKKYDRFKDETTVKLKPQKVREIAKPREELSLSVEATYKGERATRPKEVILVFDSSSEKYIYHSETEAAFIVDGKRIDAGIAHERSNLRRNPNSEETTLKLTIPFDIFAEIANGKTVEMRLRKTEVTFTPSTIGALRVFAKALNGESRGG